MAFLDVMRKALKLAPSRAYKYDLEEYPQLKGLAEIRQGNDSYREWMYSQYSLEMLRRLEYYEVNQVVQDAGVLQGHQYITPEVWGRAHSGSGWEDIKAMLPDATDNSIVKPMFTNFTQVVIDNRQIVYSVPPEAREVMIGDDVDEDQSAMLNDVYESCNHDIMADQLCKWVGLFSTAFQQIAYDEHNDRIYKTNLKPQDVYVIPSPERLWDLQHPACFVAVKQDLNWQTKQRPDYKIVWQCWWGEYWWYETEECVPFQDILLTTQGINENPYKDLKGNPVKPIIVAHDKLSGQIHDAGSDILVQQNQAFDRGFTGVCHTQEFQGFAVPVYTGVELEEVEAQPYSPAAPQVFRSPTAKMSFEHPAAPIGESLGAVIKEMRTAARLHQVDPELVDPETKVQSGVSRAQGRIALAERRTVEFPKWIPFERESYWITSIVWNTHVIAGSKFTLIARFDSPSIPTKTKFTIVVQFGELAPVTDALADASTNKINMENNLITGPEIIAAQRQIPIKRAIKIYEDTKEYNDKFNPPPTPLMAGGAGAGGDKTPRIGQSGNRAQNLDRPADKTGGNTTSASGNKVVGKK